MNDPQDARDFATTQWSLVVAANLDVASQTHAQKALEELCRAYWYPLFAFMRNRGYSPSDAEFFEALKGSLTGEEPPGAKRRSVSE